MKNVLALSALLTFIPASVNAIEVSDITSKLEAQLSKQVSITLEAITLDAQKSVQQEIDALVEAVIPSNNEPSNQSSK